MTENELKKTIAIYKKTLEVTADNGETCFRELDKNTLLFLEELERYRAIGTIDDWKRLIEKEATERRKLEEYFMLGSVEEFKDLKEKNEPKKPTICKKEYDELLEMEYFQHYCDCGNRIHGIQKYCEMCGQAIDWSE